jgi:hypothetical protein
MSKPDFTVGDLKKSKPVMTDYSRIGCLMHKESIAKIEELANEQGINVESWMRRALQNAIQLALLDAAMTEGTIKGGFGKPGPVPGDAAAKASAKRGRKAKAHPEPDNNEARNAKAGPKMGTTDEERRAYYAQKDAERRARTKEDPEATKRRREQNREAAKRLREKKKAAR